MSHVFIVNFYCNIHLSTVLSFQTDVCEDCEPACNNRQYYCSNTAWSLVWLCGVRKITAVGGGIHHII